MRTNLSAAALAATLGLGLWGCQCGGSLEVGGTSGDERGSPSASPTQPPGQDEGALPFPKEQACEMLTAEGSAVPRPVDIIMVIDNSSSMTAEIQAVESNVNVNFAQILEASGLDYRLILLAKHGSASADQSVCIQAPLSGTPCSPVPAKPVNGARFFQYDIEISSTNSLQRVLSTYRATDVHGFAPGGWKGWLREDSVKTFMEITDDESALSPQDFEAQLFALAPGVFDRDGQPEYVFHSIIGIAPNNPSSLAWKPHDPKVGQKCGSAARAGARYEDLSIRTGGLRFPVCETASYDEVFKAAAQDVIQSAKVGCEFSPKQPAAWTRYDQAYIEYLPTGVGPAQYLLEVPSADGCTEGGFTRDAGSGRITLCPGACAKVTADATAKLSVLYSCALDGPAIN
jgi:hypothetical protein